MDTATRVQILDETDCISHSTYTLIISEATRLEEEKLWIQTCKTPLKNDLVSYPAQSEGLDKYDKCSTFSFHKINWRAYVR